VEKLAVALHGFLGTPSDWDQVRSYSKIKSWLCLDYTKIPTLSPEVPLKQWGKNLQNYLQPLSEKNEIFLIGYSQGGRLALHTLLNENLISKAVIISANSGHNLTEEARQLRLKTDQAWAQRFLNMQNSWENIVQAWNSQPVFKNSTSEILRAETPDSRNIAALCLQNWSLSLQQDFSIEIKKKYKKIKWIAGEKDAKYNQASRELKKEIKNLQIDFILNAGHRVLVDEPESLANSIDQFLLIDS
jgi:2-succinyl-6-hydroxy-2,4-cyclohexadiene-1-carboxylate synthase